MATLSLSGISVSGTVYAPATAAAGGGDAVPAGDRVFLSVTNGGISSVTVTITSAQTCSQGGTHNLSVAVGAGVTKFIGPLPSARFSDLAAVSYSGVTSVTVGAFQV